MKLENIQILDEHYNPELSNIDNVNILLKKGIWNYATRHAQDLVSLYVRFHLADRESRKQIAKEKVLQELKIELPDSLIATKEDYYLPSHLKNILILSDIHLPYYDKEAVLTAIEFGINQNVDTIYLNGDIVDFNSVSRWQTSPNERDLMNEVKISRLFFKYLRNVFPTQTIIWKLGNHEERWESFLSSKASEIFNLDVLYLGRLFQVDELGIELVDGKTIAHFGNLTVVHGHELPRGIGSLVNPARGLYMKAKESALCGHHHQTSEHTEKSINGKIVSCWTTGCLSDLRPSYSTVNKYNHGFAHVQLDNEQFEVRNYKIINNKIY